MLAENIALWREEDRRITRAEGYAEGRAQEGAEFLEKFCKSCIKHSISDSQFIDGLCEVFGLSETEEKNIILKFTQ